ncbi:MAG: hypothetical protein WC421_02715 [Elusimicrobiales bacterium]
MHIFQVLLLCHAVFAFGDFKPFVTSASVKQQAAEMDFCKIGRTVAIVGYCGGGRDKSASVISPKACLDVINPLKEAFRSLYPAAKLDVYEKLSPKEAAAAIAGRDVFGFILIGAGGPDGKFVLDQSGSAIYPEPGDCPGQHVDFFAGFFSHSKYSRVQPAPSYDKAQVISRFETPPPAKYVKDSWPRTCRTDMAFVYPTATFAGRMGTDTETFIKTLSDARQAQMLKALKAACARCGRQQQTEEGELSKICPPASDICRTMLIAGEDSPVVERNFCRWIYDAQYEEAK